MMHSQAKPINMLSGPILPDMTRFALPLLATYLLDIAFTAADKMVAGQCAGSNALAAVSACSIPITLLNGIYYGLSIGATVVIARHIGEKRPDLTEQAVHTAACMSGLIGLLIALLSALFCEPLLRILKTPAEIFADSAQYFRIRIVGLSMDVIYCFSAAVLRAAGETKKPLLFSTVSGVLNVILNYVLVAGFRMGVAGLAIATNVTSLTRLVCILIFQFTAVGACRLQLRKMRIRWKSVGEIVRIGLPSCLQNSGYNVSNAFIQAAVNTLGVGAVAGGAAVITFINVADCVVQAAEHSAMTWSSQNFGAMQLERMWKIARAAMTFSACFLLPMAVCFAVFGRSLMMLFLPKTDPNLSQILYFGMTKLLFVGCPEPIHASLNVSSGLLRGIQKPWLSMVSAVVGAVALRVAWITLVFPLHPCAEIVYVCIPLAWVFASIFNWSALSVCLKKYKRAPFLPTT